MKHPLTSKERRGLVAVAAAALLCIGSGFIFRACRGGSHGAAAAEVKDSLAADSVSTDSIPLDSLRVVPEETDSTSTGIGKGKRKRSKKRRVGYESGGKEDKKNLKKKERKPKVYPVRDPLSEPCDLD